MYMLRMRPFILLSVLIMSGCIPDELTDAGKCFYRENYMGAIQKINHFLDKQGTKDDVQSKEYQAIALFYRGLSKRAYMVLQTRCVQDNCATIKFFRPQGYSGDDFATADIVSDYSMAKQLKSDLVCVDFHVGLEYVLCGQHEKAMEYLSRFASVVRSNSILNIERQFDGRSIFQESCRLTDSLLHDIGICRARTTDVDPAKRVLSFYRDILFRKSKYHEIHNIQLLTRKYSVAHFKFLLESVNFESDYNYVDKNIECGMDYLILRGSIVGDFDRLTKNLNSNGFGEWKWCENSDGVNVVSKIGVCVFEGKDRFPIRVCFKKINFRRVLLVIYSCERHSLYCVVCKEDSPAFRRMTADESLRW